MREEMSEFRQISKKPTLTQVRNKLALHIAGHRMDNTEAGSMITHVYAGWRTGVPFGWQLDIAPLEDNTP